MKKWVIILLSVIGFAVVAAGLGVLIWWLVADHDAEDHSPDRFETLPLEGAGFGNLPYRAAFTRIPGDGDVFWWFYPTLSASPTTRPIVVWLDAVTGFPPSLLANFGMIGPFDFNLNRRNDSWIDEYNLLFIDSPVSAGFSTVSEDGEIPKNLEENINHLVLALESFYGNNEEFAEAPLYIFGQGYGAQLALSLAISLNNTEYISPNLKGVVLGNGIVSPAVALTKLGFYLEELGYIDGRGREAIESFSNETTNLVNAGQLGDAFDKFLSLGNYVNNNAGAVAVNLGHIVDKLTRQISARDYFSQQKYLSDVTGFNLDFSQFMDQIVAPALGISDPAYSILSVNVVQAFRDYFMVPATDKIEQILNSTSLSVSIYNGNLDAISNTPGQLEWINDLQWSGQDQFLNSSRVTLVVNSLVQGYFRETERFKFYWINAAGHMSPLDSPAAMRRVVQRIMGN